ncbi:hypothetical protein [Candidatus Berkiella aquae]|uniref:Uncharacterized protein n=1 Tax=Candidatus Berkiella aquae TaxID=295108 RepID=A0A0Q9YME7_9GAMM|nr:hypothetical protein [Candidatus Berkiella aquae]MCS5710361.1 hypothetical protein [Candidatus Berkiella aquae]
MAQSGPEKEVVTALWDIAGHIHNALNSETVKEVAETVGEELKEVATSGSALGTTESVAKEVLPEVAKAFFNPENMCHISEGLFNNAKDVCTLADAPTLADASEASSYFGYAMGGLGTLLSAGLGIFAINKLRNARATAQSLIKPEIYAELKDSPEALELIEAIKGDKAKVALVNALKAEDIRALLALEALSKGSLAMMAKMKLAGFAHALETAVKPSDLEHGEDLVEKGVIVPVLSSIVGTSNAASSTPVQPTVELADTILVSEAGRAVLAKIRTGEEAKAELAKMNKAALTALEKHAPKLVAKDAFAATTDHQLALMLSRIIDAAAKAENKTSLTM